MTQSPALTSARIDSTLAEVLARPEYAVSEPSVVLRWFQRAVDWVWRHVRRIVDAILPELDPDATIWGQILDVLLFVGALAGGLVISYLVILALRAWRGRVRRREAVAAQATAPTTAHDWQSVARQAAAAGDWRAASLATYQAVIHRIAERGVVRLDAAKTPGDYRRELRRSRSELTPLLEAFVRAFEPAAYGRAGLDSEYFARLRESAAPLGVRV